MRAEKHRSQSPELLADLAETVISLARRLNNAGHDQENLVQLSPLEGLMMRQIDHNPGISPSRLRTLLDLKSSNVSVTLRDLEAKGMITRRSDARDARSIAVFPTPLAHKNLAHKREAWAALIAAHIDPAGNAGTAGELLEKLNQSLAATQD